MNSLSKIREDLKTIQGKKVMIKECGGRKKDKLVEGVVLNCYKSIFIIEDTEQNRQFCYTYGDVLTNKVIINAN